jgi:hypothetical protein
VDWSDKFYLWGELAGMAEILDKAPGHFYVYTGESKAQDLATIEHRLWQAVDKASVVKETVYRNDGNGAQLVKYSID